MAPRPKPSKQPKQLPKPTTPQQQQQQLPNWPPLTPILPPDSLILTTLLPNQIVTISNLWTSTLCAKYVSFLRSLPLTTTPGVPKKGDAVRVNDRFQIDDAGFAQRLWSETGLSEVVGGVEDAKIWGGEVLGLNPNIRIYRYSKGQFFDQHCGYFSPVRVEICARLLTVCLQTTIQTTSLSRLLQRLVGFPPRRLGRCCCIFRRLLRAVKVARRSFILIRLVGVRLHRLLL
jgi:hypothetical protein